MAALLTPPQLPVSSVHRASVRVLPAASFTRRLAAWCWDALPFEILYLLIVSTTHAWSALAATAVGQTATLMGLPSGAATAAAVDPSTVLIFPEIAAWGPWLLLALYFLWHIGWEATSGTTPGKHLVGIRIASARAPAAAALHPAPLGGRLATMRLFSCGLSWLLLNIGHAMIRWRKDGAALHDLLTHTRVVADPTASWVSPLGVMRPRSSQVQFLLLVLGITMQVLVSLAAGMMLVAVVRAAAAQLMLGAPGL